MTTRKLYSEELVQLSESLEEMGSFPEKFIFFHRKQRYAAGRADRGR